MPHRQVSLDGNGFCLPLRGDDTVVAAQVHEGKEAEQTVVVGIEVAVVERNVLGIPKGINKLLALVVTAHHGGGSRGGHQSDAVAQLAETASLQNLVAFGQRTVNAILVDELVNSLSVEEILDGLAVFALPFAVGTAPFVVEGDVHGHAP